MVVYTSVPQQYDDATYRSLIAIGTSISFTLFHSDTSRASDGIDLGGFWIPQLWEVSDFCNQCWYKVIEAELFGFKLIGVPTQVLAESARLP